MNVRGKLRNLLAFGTLGPVNDSGPVQTAQISVGYMETQDGRPMVGWFGLASNPPRGTNTVSAYQEGDRSNGVVIGTNHQASRPKGQQPGEVTLYNDSGIKIYLSNSGIVINGGGKVLTITNCPSINYTGNINLTGTLAVVGVITIDGVPVVAP